MRISDLITVRHTSRAIDLASVSTLLEACERESGGLTLTTASQLEEVVGEYVTPDEPQADVLRALLTGIAGTAEGGKAALVRGGAGSGKSHLLAVIALLLRSSAAWSVFQQTHPLYADLRSRIGALKHLVVPIPLAEHRGHEEHLEDIVFDRTERVLRSASYGIPIPLSEQSYALSLIQRHIVPRYGEELDAYTTRHAARANSWEALRKIDPSRAAQIAREFAREMQYPLDFRQSRVERLSRLLDVIRENQLSGIVWLIDDLSEFLSGAGPKAVHGDCAFLDFLGQRCKIEPLHTIAVLNEGLEQLTSIEPYLINAIRAGYRTDLVLSPQHMRRVARRRVIGRSDPERYSEAVERVRTAYQTAFAATSFSADELAESYPLHPAALECLEGIAARFFGAADTLLAFMQDLMGQTDLAGLLGRDYRRLIGADHVFDYLRARIASHPEVSSYIYDVLDYYQRNAQEVLPDDPELCVRLARLLIVFRLANIAAPVPLLVESLGLDDEGQAAASQERVIRALEAMRMAGSFVDVRRGVAEGPAVYCIDSQTSVSESLRRRVAAAKASYQPDDLRVWRYALEACDEAAFPLAHLREPRTLEVQWENTFRCISAEVTDLTALPVGAISEYVTDLQDPATVEDACLLIAVPARREEQVSAWKALSETAPSSRWASAVLAWIPRPLNAQELDRLREFAAISEMAENERLLEAESGLRDQLMELHPPARSDVRKIVQRAYYDGQVLSPFHRLSEHTEFAGLSGDWPQTLQAIAAPALQRVFPEFSESAPRRPLISRDQIDALVQGIIWPGRLVMRPDDPRVELIRSYLIPLGLVIAREDTYTVDVSRSKVAAGILARVRQRDQTPMSETGRPIACSDVAQHLVKSPMGLPPEMFELAVAALIRTGYLAGLRDRTQLIRYQDIGGPLSGTVNYIARPPILSHGRWQVLSRVCRIALDLSLTKPDFPVQQYAWERLVEAREKYVNQAEALRARLAAHVQELEQRPAQWHELFADIDALQNCFRCVRPELHPAVGLREFVDDVEGFIGDSQGASRLTGLFRRIDNLTLYLDKIAPDVVEVRQYMLSDDLVLGRGTDLEVRRQQIIDLIGGGESILPEEMNLRRLVQTFLGTYKRKYISWHGRVYRSPIFDQYRAVHQSPEMRALSQLSKVHVKVPVTAEDVARRVDEQVARRCIRADLNEALDHMPICPDCRLRVDDEPDLLPVDALIQEAARAIGGYLKALSVPALKQRVLEYAAAAPRKNDLGARLTQIAELGPDGAPRQVLNLFTDDTISHLNRALSGKLLAPRNLGELRKALQGRTVTKEEAQTLFKAWLEGEGPEVDEDGLVQIDG